MEHFEFLKTYDRIDIALDTIPYSGGTTTMEALWQGVPVLTFPGDRWVSRISSSLFRAARLHEWICVSRTRWFTQPRLAALV
jgi:protein O-GlcNAc transferase